MVSTVASLVSIGLAVYFYYAGIRRRDLSYYFHPIRTKIATIGEDSRLRATYDGRELKGSLTAMQFAIWNAGDEPIRPDDVLDRVTVTAPPGVRVLDIKVRQEARRVVGFRVDDTQKSEGVLDLSWKILERNDGAVVQVLFEGAPDAPFRIDGAIVGQPRISDVRGIDVNLARPEDVYRAGKTARWSSLVFGLVFVFLGFLLAVLFLRVLRQMAMQRRQPVRRREEAMALVPGVVLLALGAFLLYLAMRQSGVPFDF